MREESITKARDAANAVLLAYLRGERDMPTRRTLTAAAARAAPELTAARRWDACSRAIFLADAAAILKGEA